MDSLPAEVIEHIVGILCVNEPAHTWIDLRHTSSGFKQAVERVFATIFIPDMRLHIHEVNDHVRQHQGRSKPHMVPLVVNLHATWRNDWVLGFADAPHAALGSDTVDFGPKLRSNASPGQSCDLTPHVCVCGVAASVADPAAVHSFNQWYVVPPQDCPMAVHHIIVSGWTQVQQLAQKAHHLVIKVTTANSEREHAIVELVATRLPITHTGALLTLGLPWKRLLTLVFGRVREQQRMQHALGLDRPAHRAAAYDHDAAGRLVLKPPLQSLYIEPEPSECYCAARSRAMRGHVRAANAYIHSCAWASGSAARRTALRRDAARALRGRFFPPGPLAWEELVRCRWCGALGRAQLLLGLSPGLARGFEYRHMGGPWQWAGPEAAVARARQAPVWEERGELGMVVPRRALFLGVVLYGDPLQWRLRFWPAWVRECLAVGRDRKWLLQQDD